MHVQYIYILDALRAHGNAWSSGHFDKENSADVFPTLQKKREKKTTIPLRLGPSEYDPQQKHRRLGGALAKKPSIHVGSLEYELETKRHCRDKKNSFCPFVSKVVAVINMIVKNRRKLIIGNVTDIAVPVDMCWNFKKKPVGLYCLLTKYPSKTFHRR